MADMGNFLKALVAWKELVFVLASIRVRLGE